MASKRAENLMDSIKQAENNEQTKIECCSKVELSRQLKFYHFQCLSKVQISIIHFNQQLLLIHAWAY